MLLRNVSSSARGSKEPYKVLVECGVSSLIFLALSPKAVQEKIDLSSYEKGNHRGKRVKQQPICNVLTLILMQLQYRLQLVGFGLTKRRFVV